MRDSFSVASGYSSVSDEATIPYLDYDGLPKDFVNSMLDHSMKMVVSLLKLKKKQNTTMNIDGYLRKMKNQVNNNNL